MTPDEEFEIILRCINYEAPETWRDRIQSRVDNILRHWGRTSPAEGSPENLDPYIDRANQLISNQKLSQEAANYLVERVEFWQNEQAARWNKLADNWIREANNLTKDEGLKFLSSHMAGKIPSTVRAVFKALTEARLQEILDEASQMAGNNNYAEANSTVTEGNNRLQQETHHKYTRCFSMSQ